MEMNFNGEGDSEARKFVNFSIREYVAEVQRKDRKKCCPFKLFVDSKEPNCQADVVSAPQLPETSDAPDESDDITLDAFIKKQKHAQVCGGALKKRKTRQVLEPRVDKVKRSKFGPEESHGNVPVVGSKCDSRKNLDMQTRKKRIKSSAEIRTQKDDKLLANACLSKDTETAYDSVQRKTRESSPPTANEKTLALRVA